VPDYQSGRGGGASQIAKGRLHERDHLRIGRAPVQVITTRLTQAEAA